MAEMTRDAARLEATGERIAEIGKFDFRYGKPPAAGYYHHWSTFSEIADTPEDFIFILTDGRKIIIPRSAFSNEDEAQTFLTLARERRQTAELNLHYSTMGSGGIWPPPPRIGA